MHRRLFLGSALAGAGALVLRPDRVLAGALASGHDVPVHALTHRPGGHWFGYYDKLQFSPDDRLVLGMHVETGVEGRTPETDDALGIGWVDTARGDAWTEVGTSRAWGWQQGCMLQWRPGASTEIVWNDRDDTGDPRFVARVLDTATGAERTLPAPIYALSPDGAWAVGADFARIQRLRPGYGYKGVEDAHADSLAPDDGGRLPDVARRERPTPADCLARPPPRDSFRRWRL